MKYLFYAFVLLLFASSCKKQIKTPPIKEEYYYGNWQEVQRTIKSPDGAEVYDVLYHTTKTPLSKFIFQSNGVMIISSIDTGKTIERNGYYTWVMWDDALFVQNIGRELFKNGANKFVINFDFNTEKVEVNLERL